MVKLPIDVKFIIHLHKADRAGTHHDLRIQHPDRKNRWISFAIRKGMPLVPGKRVLAVETHVHSDEQALFTGHIKQGYGAGHLSVYDSGIATIEKFTSAHIKLIMDGRKVNGPYQLINVGVSRKGIHEYKEKKYMIFKTKT